MFKKQLVFKSLILILFATFYQTNAADVAIGVDATTSSQAFFASPEADLIKFCRAEFERSMANSSKQMFNDSFVSGQERQDLLKQAQEEVKPEAQEREVQVQQLFEHKVGQLATRNYTAILNDFLVSGRKCLQSASSNGQANGQDAFGEPKKSVSNLVLDDLRILSGNKTSGLFNVTQRLFGKNGLAPVSTPAGFSAATYALTNPEANKEKLEKRRTELLRLVANPELVGQLREQLNAYAKARSGSFDQMLNPNLPEPFDQKKHGSKRSWNVEVASKIVDFREYLNLDQALKEKVMLEEWIKNKNGREKSISAIIRLIEVIKYRVERFCKYFESTFYGKACIGLPLFQTKLMLNFVYNCMKNFLSGLLATFIIAPILMAVYILAVFSVVIFWKFLADELGNSELNKLRKFLSSDQVQTLISERWTGSIRPFCSRLVFKNSVGVNGQAFDHMRVSNIQLLAGFLGVDPSVSNTVGSVFFNFLFSRKVLSYILKAPFVPIIRTFNFALRQFMAGNKRQKAFGVVFVGSIAFIFLAKTVYDWPINKNRLLAIGQLLDILDNLQNMIKSGRNCEKIFSGQSTTVDKSLENKELDFNRKIKQLTSRKNHKLTYLPIYRYEQTISLFQEFLKNSLVDPNGKVVLSDSKVILDGFTPMHERIGEIDLLVSLAELVIKSKGQKAEFAVVDFVHGSGRAIVDGKAVWNTLINREVVVPNDVEIGVAQENGKFVQGNMVTAGNGCGKSVHIIAVATAVYLAQCLGVAPAKSLTITPFDRFVTQINTVDDPLNNKSLFRAQIRQFGQMVTEITSGAGLDKKLTFVCLDESLSGTKPKYAGPLLAALVKCKLSTSNRFAMLFATHLEHLASVIEKLSNGSIVPVQVKCNLDSTGHFESSTFEINPGPSSIDSAFKVAQEEWVDFMSGREVEELVCEAKGLFGNA